MDMYDIKYYSPGSKNAQLLEERIRHAGAWPEVDVLAQKLLRRNLTILRNGEMADYKAYSLIINRQNSNRMEVARLRYWRNKSGWLYQNLERFDWPGCDLSIDEIRERLLAVGIDPQQIDDDFEAVRLRGEKKVAQLIAKEEKRQKEALKWQKFKEMLDTKYTLLLKRVEQEQDLHLGCTWFGMKHVIVRIYWNVTASSTPHPHRHFSIYDEYTEDEYATAFPSTVSRILQVTDLCQELANALEEANHRITLRDGNIYVIPKIERHSMPYYILRHIVPDGNEPPILEGKDVDLAQALFAQINALGLKIAPTS